MTTYNNIVDSLRAYAASHLQVGTFYSGQKFDFQANDTNAFPAVILIPQPSRFIGGKTVFSFQLYVADRLKEDLSNLDEVLSDTALILNDFVSEFDEGFETYGFALEDGLEVSAEPFQEDLDFRLAGWVALNFDVQVRMARDCSAAPVE